MTMAETVIVLTIVAIVTAAALHRFAGDSSTLQRKNAAEVLLGDMRYAHEVAMASGKAIRVVISVEQNAYSLYWDNTGEALPRPVGGGDFVRIFGKEEFLHAKITETNLSVGKLVFRPNGEALMAGEALSGPVLVASVNNQYNIMVSPVTGNLSLEANE